MDKAPKTHSAGRKVQDETPAGQEEFCPWCGLTRRELYAQGQMGCARCYNVFGGEVRQALREIHGAVEHIGKAKAARQ